MTPRALYRRNFAAFMGDYVGFMLALTFANSTTVLPDFVSRLSDSKVLVGLFTSLGNGAWLLPQLLFANLLTNKRRKKPYIMLGAALGRPFYLLYAIALALGLYRYPALALGALVAVQILFFSTDALASVGWFDVLSKAIPIERRGRLIGSAQFTGGVLSIGAGMLIAALLSDNGPGFPHDYAAVLALAGVCLLFALFSLGFVVEPDEPVEERRPAWRDYLPQLLHTLRQDRAFARLILVQLLAGFDGLAIGFYILFATQELGLPPGYVGAFTTVLTIGKIAASVGLGALAERAGSHRVIQVSIAFSLSAPLVGLALLLADAQPNALTAALYSWVFIAIGVMISSRMLGYYSYALALAPAGQRPTYIGLFNTIGGALIVLPTLGGWLLRVSSYGVLFALTASVLGSACVLGLSLPSARRAEQLEKSGKTS